MIAHLEFETQIQDLETENKRLINYTTERYKNCQSDIQSLLNQKESLEKDVSTYFDKSRNLECENNELKIELKDYQLKYGFEFDKNREYDTEDYI